ncbi:hypothetical protein [Kitasatospora sp. NPDC051705]|uniref:hypothetical protein n=1 Tax=Kitasatospora sp. NPDC051705 TaxID=3364057 RepID=UPI0037A9C5B5
MFQVLWWLYVLCPLGCWAALSRTRLVGMVVAAVLLGQAIVLIGLDYEWWAPLAAAEVTVTYPFTSILVSIAGVLTERRLRGIRPISPDGRLGGTMVTLAGQATISVVIATAYPFYISANPYYPSLAELPIPPGLTIEHDSGTSGGCALHDCGRELSIGSVDGLRPSQVVTRLRNSLIADGWTVGPSDSLEHPHGWLLDRRVVRAFVTEGPRGASVELVGPERSGAPTQR